MTGPGDATSGGPSARSSRVAISTLFFTLGVGFGDWVVRIPDVQHGLGLSQGTLGTALLALSVGSIIGMPVAGYLSTRWDAAVLTTASAAVFTVSLALPALAPNLWALIGVLVVMGFGNGALGVTMNAQGALLERRWDSPIMGSFHGVFSIGGLLGSLVAGSAAGAGVSARDHLGAVAAVLTVLVALSARYLIRHRPDAAGRALSVPGRGMATFGLLALCGLLCEGSVSDWSAVLMRDVRHVSAGLVGLGYTGFAVAMAATRLRGDWMAARLGPRATVFAAGVVALVGALVVVAVPMAWASIAGFTVLGAGLAVVFPTVVSVISAREAQPAAAVSAVSTVGYAGFLTGPPVIGYLAQATSLPTALLVIVACGCAITVFSRALPTTVAASA